MSKRFIFENETGGVSVMSLAPGARLESVLQKLGKRGDQVHEVDADSLPPDDEYRNAWKLTGGKVIHDMAKARDIRLKQIRDKRNADLAASDRDVVIQIESGGVSADLKKERQRLRDIPQTLGPSIEQAKTVAELRQIGVE